NTPCTASPDGRSPAENFIGRRLRSTLDLLKPSHAPEARPDIAMEKRLSRRHGAKPRKNTPCTASPDGRSPAENFIGRRLRSTLDLLKPSHAPEARPDIAMEKQFNRRHGAKPRKFEPDDLVYARDFRSGQPRWSPGRILLRHGRTLYDVLVQESIWKRHANQLRPRASPEDARNLMDAFDMPFNSTPVSPSRTLTPPLSPMVTTAPSTTTTPATTTTTTPLEPPTTAPGRRSSRTRRPPDYLQIDPYAKSYQSRQS
ncbi:hypothetical protein OSTOST_05590, partial [Ostertagia ostertagi]